MNTTLLLTGLACVIAAAIGGGLKAFGIEIPVLQSIKRQLILAALGIALIVAVSIPLPKHPDSTPASTQSDSTPASKQSDSTWNSDPWEWPYQEEIKLNLDNQIVFHGLVLTLDDLTKKADSDQDRAHVGGELDGKSFGGWYSKGERLTVSNEHCEFSIRVISVYGYSKFADVYASGNCKE